MKSLLLLRHAKTKPLETGGLDFDRELTERGAADAMKVGHYLRQQQIKLDLIVSSPAKRARETTELVLEGAGLTNAAFYDPAIYETDASRLMDMIHGFDSRNSSVLVVGHNPGMEDLLTILTGERHSLRTSTLAIIETDVDEWERLETGNCCLRTIFCPAES